MGIPQVVFLMLQAMALGIALVNDGKVIAKKESFLSTSISVGITLALLWWGGFFG